MRRRGSTPTTLRLQPDPYGTGCDLPSRRRLLRTLAHLSVGYDRSDGVVGVQPPWSHRLQVEDTTLSR